jgi:IclR family acetate operon transcriptional repressor
MKPTKAYNGTQAVQRAMRLLKAFSHGGPELGLSELAKTVELNKSTTFRLLTALENAEMIERTPSGEAYRLGPELLRLGSQTLELNGVAAAARVTLRELAEQTRETVTLEVLVGDEVLTLDEIIGKHMIGALPSLGTRWPAHATSTGKVLLAALPEDELRARIAGRLEAITPRTITDADAFVRELARVRSRGFATNVEELEPGFVAASAPVRAASGAVVAAIGISGPKSRLGSQAIAALARTLPEAADSVSVRLGWRRPARLIKKGKA